MISWNGQARGETPPGIEPRKAFQRLLVRQEKAAIAYRRAQAADHLSKLNNTVGRAAPSYKAGDLVMVWRELKNFGKGAWTGPVRVLHVEGFT